MRSGFEFACHIDRAEQLGNSPRVADFRTSGKIDDAEDAPAKAEVVS